MMAVVVSHFPWAFGWWRSVLGGFCTAAWAVALIAQTLWGTIGNGQAKSANSDTQKTGFGPSNAAP